MDSSQLKCSCSKQSSPSNDETNSLLNSKLDELKQRLAPKPFKQNFVDSLVYLLRLEHKTQLEFQQVILSSDLKWSQIEYALHELKKICKQKHVILILVNKMSIQSKQTQDKPVFTNINEINSKQTIDDLDEDSNMVSLDKINLVNELDDLNNLNQDVFSLIRILIRLVFKLFKLNANFNSNLEAKVSNFKLVLLSFLADLCHYEEIKLQVRLIDLFFENLINLLF